MEPGRGGQFKLRWQPGNVAVVRPSRRPPPAPVTPVRPVVPKRIITSPRVLNGLALSLPKPPYPPIAKQAGAQGPVNVQVLIDETGKVVSAKAISGSPLLMHAAQQAAYGSALLANEARRSGGEGFRRDHLQLRAAIETA